MVRRGAAVLAAIVLSAGLDTALGVTAAWAVGVEVVAAAAGMGRGRGRARRLKRCTAIARHMND